MIEHIALYPRIVTDDDFFDTTASLVARLKKWRYAIPGRSIRIKVSQGMRISLSLMYIADHVQVGDKVLKNRWGPIDYVSDKKSYFY